MNYPDVVNRSELCIIDEFEIAVMNNTNVAWWTDVLSKPKMRTYVKFKIKITSEKYRESTNISRSQHSLLAQLRTGTLRLEIELGRFRNIKPDGRFCKFCNNGDTEDEFHFISKYKLHDGL